MKIFQIDNFSIFSEVNVKNMSVIFSLFLTESRKYLCYIFPQNQNKIVNYL